MAGVNGNSPRGFIARESKPNFWHRRLLPDAEQIDATLRNQPAQAWLEGDVMKITPLN